MKRRGEKWLVPVSLHRLVRYRYEDSFQLTLAGCGLHLYFPRYKDEKEK